MRISDWSSDVCSSDLDHPVRRESQRGADRLHGADRDRRGGDQAVRGELNGAAAISSGGGVWIRALSPSGERYAGLRASALKRRALNLDHHFFRSCCPRIRSGGSTVLFLATLDRTNSPSTSYRRKTGQGTG